MFRWMWLCSQQSLSFTNRCTSYQSFIYQQMHFIPVFHLPTDALHISLSFTNRCTSYQSFIYQQMHFISVFHLPTDALHTSLSFTNRCTSYQSFIYQQMHFISVLENIKIHIKTYIKIAPTCFGLRPSSGSLHMSLAKVTFIKSVKVRRYGLCRCGAACCHTTATLMISGCTVQR